MTGWRRAFCTSIPKDTVSKDITNESQSPRISSKFGFFSNPSTPRSHSHSRRHPDHPGLGLRCRTSVATSGSTPSSTPNSPKLMTQKKTGGSRLLFQFSNPSSPKSPSSFSFIKTGLRLSKVSKFFFFLSAVLCTATSLSQSNMVSYSRFNEIVSNSLCFFQ